MVRVMQTSSFLNMRKNFLPRNLTMAPRYPSLISHLGCINMRVLHTSAIPGGACMALVSHCDTNQGSWRAPLSCKQRSLLVLFKCLPSLFLLSLTLAQPLPCFTLHPWLQPSLSASPSFSSPSKSAAERRASDPGVAAEAGLAPGGQCVSHRMGLFPGPTKTISYSNVTIRPPTHWGLFMAAAPGRRVKMVI